MYPCGASCRLWYTAETNTFITVDDQYINNCHVSKVEMYYINLLSKYKLSIFFVSEQHWNNILLRMCCSFQKVYRIG